MAEDRVKRRALGKNYMSSNRLKYTNNDVDVFHIDF